MDQMPAAQAEELDRTIRSVTEIPF